MGFDFSSVFAPIPPKPIAFRGATLHVRTVMTDERLALDAQLQKPLRLMDSDKTNPGFLKLETQRESRIKAATVGISCGLKDDTGAAWTPSRDGTWVAGFADEIMKRLTPAELMHLWQEVLMLDGVFKDPSQVIGTGEQLGN